MARIKAVKERQTGEQKERNSVLQSERQRKHRAIDRTPSRTIHLSKKDALQEKGRMAVKNTEKKTYKIDMASSLLQGDMAAFIPQFDMVVPLIQINTIVLQLQVKMTAHIPQVDMAVFLTQLNYDSTVLPPA
ncbi:hypothetical protein PoB_000983100 [Plakobranchus ocellatus]|uniref:Uncharacterized protein n=1 Tax=Plakobranchus ocellatus TaxID=259542 RepID=A0AAV3YJA0_9GAST|nr:hypothetical protein PoB_000983100 [Plakobranchus ocellatus]